MSAALAHRGPDDRGQHDDDGVSLGFRRLAVIDLETGAQPIALADRGLVIVLNGEIYNYRELRRELEGRHAFRTRGDVEVVLRLFAEQGLDCVARLDGMFAFAIWDARGRTLYLARDRFGVKPLYYCRQGPALAFASEVGALLAGGFPGAPEIDPLQLRHYLCQRYPAPERAAVRGIDAVAPGTILAIGPHGERTHRFWDPPAPGGAGSREADAEVVARVARRVEEAVRRQLVADVPVGVFLSGGIDSGVLASCVARAGQGPLRTFSVGFDGEGVANELPVAAAHARHFGAEHHEIFLRAERVAADLPAILAAADGPLGDPTLVPTWYLSRLARETVTVALSGEGADELFGGYPRQRFDVWIDRLGRLGRAAAPRALAWIGRRPSERLRARLAMRPGLERQLDWSRTFGPREIDDLALEPPGDEASLLALHARLAERWRRLAVIDPVHARLEADRELFLVGDLLPKVDRMSMAHSLEVRVPYLDNALADDVLSQPGSRKIRGREFKWLLRRVAQPRLPPGAAARRKQGFDVPIVPWLRGPLRPVLEDYLSPQSVRTRGLFRPERVRALVTAHARGEADHGERLWTLVALEGWLRGALDRRPAERMA